MLTLATALALCLASAVAGADDVGAGGCAWGPIADVQAAQALLDTWAASTGLPPFAKDQSDLSIDGGGTRVKLQFAKGTLTLAWRLDDECKPTAVTIQTSPDYDGTRPDDAAVKQLVASLGTVTVTVEQRSGPLQGTYSALWRWVRTAVTALLAGLLLLLAVRRWRAAAVPLGRVTASLGARLTGLPSLAGRCWRAAAVRLGQVTASSLIRLLGLVGIVALLPYQSAPSGAGFGSDWLSANFLVLIGILPLITFLWLAVSGYFGYGSPSRADWPALVVCLLALGIREGYARHAIADLEIHFFYGTIRNRHSVVHPLLQMFLQPLARDPYLFMLHVNGILGALAALPLYLFVRQRTNSRMTAALVATFFAVHPIIVQMAPTDGQYSVMLFTWFSGLALLTANDVGARQLVGGAGLLGIAATCRAEGSLFLVASLLLIDVRGLLAAVRRHVGAAALACGIVLGLVAVHAYYSLPAHVPSGQYLPHIGSLALSEILRAGLLSLDFNDPIFVALVAVGALAGLINKRLRIGLGAALATLVVGWPVSVETTRAFTVLHRLVPLCAVQAIAAGVGASWITSWLPSRIRQHWVAAIPALIVALYLFTEHRHEVRDPNGVTDEFWMLRNHLAPGGVVKKECTLLSVGRSMDVDIHDFSQVLPGMTSTHCEQEDCVRIVSAGGCFYYLRSLSCYFADVRTPPECVERGRTATGDLFACIDPRCAQLEGALELSAVDERTVDMNGALYGSQYSWPRIADIGLYRVLGVRDAAAVVPPK